MRTLLRGAATALAVAAFAPVLAKAQAVWDAPSFMRPGSPSGLSIALTDSDPGDGLGVLGLWRSSAAPTGLGFRAGVAEASGDEVVAIFGVDVSGSLSGALGPDAPEAIWWTGAGIGVGSGFSASFPLGVAFGWTGRDEGVAFMPYAGAHVVLDVMSGEGDDMDLDAALDLGLDLAFDRGWTFRFGAAIGGRQSLGIGVRVPR